MVATAIHANLVGIELHYSKLNVVNGPPITAPIYKGETQYDQDNNILYIATGVATSADWQSQSVVTKVIDNSTTSYTVLSTDNGHIFSMTNTGARAITLPTSPINSFYVGVQDGAGTAFTGAITIAAGGNIFPGGGSTYKITSNGACVIFIFDLASSTWTPVSSFIGYQPVVKEIVGFLGLPLIMGTADTNNVQLNVNNVNAIDIGATAIDFKLSGVSALNLGATNLEVKKIFIIDDITDITKQLIFDVSQPPTGVRTILSVTSTANRDLELPDISDRIVARNSVDILTNKSINDPLIMRAGNPIRFYNPAQTFYTSLQGGSNLANLAMTLPTTAPLAGQALVSLDTSATLGWATVADSQQYVSAATTIDALPCSTSSVLISGFGTPTNLTGIITGAAGQQLIVTNVSNSLVTITNNATVPAGSSHIATNILTAVDYYIPPSTSIIFVYDIGQDLWRVASQVAAANIQGSVSGVEPQAGVLGQQIRKYAANATTDAALYKSLVPIVLTSGVWDISFLAYGYNVIGSQFGAGLSTQASGGLPSDWVLGDNYASTDFSGIRQVVSVPNYRVILTSTTTYYVVVIGASSVWVRNSAVRVG
jgi:hypothetical protein